MLASILVLAAASAASAGSSPLIEQIGDTGFFQLEAPSFDALTPAQKRLAYWLSRAAIATDPIVYDQLSAYGLREKRLVGALIEDPSRLPAESRDAIVRYAKLFLGNRGNHNATTNVKFVPEVPFEVFKAAAAAALKGGAPLGEAPALERLLSDLQRPMFDVTFEPSPTEKNPPAGQDIITASSNTFYGAGVTFADVKDFQDPHPLNSRIVKEGGQLVEQVYRAGTPDGSVKPGLYAKELGQAIAALTEAAKEADPVQRKVIEALISYFQTGSADDWHDFSVLWVQNDADVDFVDGFIESYRDTRSAKGAAESLIAIKDATLNPLMKKLAANALYFEKKAPWPDVYKKLDVKAPVGKAVEAVLETADFSVGTVGDNLPNEEDLHRQYGTKNFLISNAAATSDRFSGPRVVQEFQPDDVAAFDKHGVLADNLMTAMHEIIGHGSGKGRDGVDPGKTLLEYYSTLEEARADLVAYWDTYDPKLTQLGVKHQTEVGLEMYAQLARSIFTVLQHYPTGTQAEEDHDRDTLLIWNWVAERGGVELVERNQKHFARVGDYAKARKAVGELLVELTRIKGEGDYPAAKALIEKYGLHFDPKLRDEVVARYNALGLPTYKAGVYGDLMLDKGVVTITYPRDFLKQQVAFARLNGTLGF